MTEFEYIKSLMNAGKCGPDILQSIGDDCAVIKKSAGKVLLAAMDTLVEGVHFNPHFHPPGLLGRKVVSVNVSDIAAMGGTPLAILLSCGLPLGFDEGWASAFNDGVRAACFDYDCALIGGDTVASPGGLNFTVAILGEMAENEVLYRSAAKAGDRVYVSGPLGLAAAGLALLQADLAEARPEFAEFVRRHLNPEARLCLGQRLAQSGLVHAMIDSSDGLATDLAHICQASCLGAQVLAKDLPLSAGLHEAARACHADAREWALRGGEDFELIFTAAPERAEELSTLAQACGLSLHPLGFMDSKKGLRLVQESVPGVREIPLDFQGYEHFSR